MHSLSVNLVGTDNSKFKKDGNILFAGLGQLGALKLKMDGRISFSG